MTVWFVSELYYPEATSTGYYVTGIAEGLAATATVKVLCSQPTYASRGLRVPAHEIRKGVEIFRGAGTTFDKNTMLLRLVNLMTITFSLFALALRSFRPGDIVIVTTNPPSLPFVIRFACAMRGAHCVLLVHDVYPDVLVATGMLRQRAVATRLLNGLQRLLVRSMARVVVIGRDMERLMRRRATGDAVIELIPNWADLEDIAPSDRQENALLSTLGIAERFVVQYSGNIGRTHGIDTLLSAADRLRDDRVQFLFIGDGARRRVIEQAIASGKTGNVTLLAPQPRQTLSTSLNACDVAVVSLAPGMSGVSVPSRMYNILAAGKPIVAVADDESELARVVREEQVGWVVPPGDVEALVSVVRLARTADLRPIRERARAAVERSYSYRGVVERYRDLLDDILASSPPATA